jgi:hypothetical protein
VIRQEGLLRGLWLPGVGSNALGGAISRGVGTLLVFEHNFALDIGPHGCSLEASKRVTNGIPLGCPPPLTGSHCKLCCNTEGMGCYPTVRDFVDGLRGPNQSKDGFSMLAAGFVSGAAGYGLSNPFWLLKTRIQAGAGKCLC